jgi:hypothetical protein
MFALTWKDEIFIGDLLTIVGFLLTVAGLFFAGWQFQRKVLVERGRFLVEMADRFLEEEGVANLFYDILNQKFHFNPQHPPDSGVQQNLDALLATFNMIGQLLQMRILRIEDARFFIAEAHAVLHNPHVQQYMVWANAPDGHPPEGGWWAGANYLAQQLFPNAHAPGAH